MIDLAASVPQPAVQVLAWTLIHFLWQGAILGGAAFVLLRVVRPERASSRYVIGVATLGLMLLSATGTFVALARQPDVRPPLSVVPLAPSTSIPGSSVTGWVIADLNRSPGARGLLSSARSDIVALHPSPLGPPSVLLIVFAWATGVFILSVRLVGGWLVTRRLAQRAVETVSPSLEAVVDRLAVRLRLRRAVAILQSQAVAVPTLVGWMKPVVLLPASALSGLSAEQLQAILAHELAHVGRHDYLINLLQSVVETLLFYHPAIWWVSAQVREAREHCCDDVAIELCGDRLVYVSALAELTALARPRAFALAATDGSVLGRVRRLLGAPRPTPEMPPVWTALAVLALIVVSAGAFAPNRESSARPHDVALQTSGSLEVIAWAQTPQRPPEPPVPPSPPAGPEPPGLPAVPELSAPLAPPPPPASPSLLSAPVPPAPTAPPAPLAVPAPPPPPAPAAWPMPPAPPTPPTPPPPLWAQTDQGHTSGNFSRSTDHDKLFVKWTGAFRLVEDERDIAWVEEGATVTISDGIVLGSRVDLVGLSGGRIERRFARNGFKREYEPDGRLFLAQAIEQLITHSGLFAKDRVARFLKQGGPDAVLNEISRLGDSSYVKRVYYTELLQQAMLDEGLLSRILQRVPTDLTSDYDRATLLVTVAKLPAVTDAHRVTVARAARTLNSDYQQRRTLSAVMDTSSVSPAVAGAVVDATSTVDSSHDRAEILTTIAKRGGVTAATAPGYMNLVRGMPSAYEQRRVLSALAAQPAVDEAVAIEAVKAAASINSSYEEATALLAFVERGSLTEASADAFFQSAGEIDSSHDLARVLRAVVSQTKLTDRVALGLFKTVAKLGAASDRANVLVEMASRHVLSGQARDLYVAAARAIDTSYEQNRALSALVRADRR